MAFIIQCDHKIANVVTREVIEGSGYSILLGSMGQCINEAFQKFQSEFS